MTVSLFLFVGAYVAFVFKHLLADYVLQTAHMAEAKGAAVGWAKPLAIHSAIHAIGTLLVVLPLAASFWWLAILDFLLHGTIDRAKAILTTGWRPNERRFWIAFGIDQSAHQLTHFAFVCTLLAAAP